MKTLNSTTTEQVTVAEIVVIDLAVKETETRIKEAAAATA